jgi:acetylornithine deacetylase/succinyl-diaminopimelate desuccinylase family protein
MNKLISFNTSNLPGNEHDCAEWAAAYLEAHGFDALLVSHAEKRSSVVAAKKGKNGGRKVVFNGHLDTVPPGGGWNTDPFRGIEKDGRIYGRGAADMKGGLASMIATAINAVQRPFTGEIMLNLVADEELFNIGTVETLPYTADADYVLIGEPTMMEIHIAHRGILHLLITFSGKSCHAGIPEQGINAIENAALGIRALKEYADALGNIKHPFLPGPTFVCSVIQGGEKDNMVPGSCSLMTDRRLIPGESPEAVEEDIRGVLDSIKKEHGEFGYTMKRYHLIAPGEIGRDTEIVRTAEEVYRECFGEAGRVTSFPASCEQTFFTSRGIPAIIIGPGSISQAHITDEFIDTGQLDKAVKFYEAFLEKTLI